MPELTVSALVASGGFNRLKDEHSSYMGNGRREDHRRRLMIDCDGHRQLINERIRQTFNTMAVQAELAQFTSVALNPLRRITDAVGGSAYRHQPVRRLDGATEEHNIAWRRMTSSEGRIGVKSRQWGRYAFLSSVVHVIPVTRIVRGSVELRYETVLPHCSTVVPSEYEEDSPAVLLYDVEHGVETSVEDPRQARHVALDSEGWWMFSTNWAPVGFVPHGLGLNPAVPFRWTPPPPGDYWDQHRNRGLAECALDVGRIFAQMEWIRKGQSRKLLIAYDPEQALPEGQTNHPERGMHVEGRRGEAEIDVRDFVTSIDEFSKEIRFLIEQAAESVGIPSNVIDPSPGGEDMANTAPAAQSRLYTALSEVRDQALEPLRRAEEDLAYMTALVARRFGHPDSLDPSMVRETFRITFPPLTFMDHPSTRTKIYGEMISLGLIDHVEAMQRENPELSREEADERLRRNIQSRGEVTRLFAQHGVTANAAHQLDNAQQAFGRMGGRPESEEDAQEQSA